MFTIPVEQRLAAALETLRDIVCNDMEIPEHL